MNELIKSIRKNYIVDVFKIIIPTVLLNALTGGMLYFTFCDGFVGRFLFIAAVSAVYGKLEIQ